MKKKTELSEKITELEDQNLSVFRPEVKKYQQTCTLPPLFTEEGIDEEKFCDATYDLIPDLSRISAFAQVHAAFP